MNQANRIESMEIDTQPRDRKVNGKELYFELSLWGGRKWPQSNHSLSLSLSGSLSMHNETFQLWDDNVTDKNNWKIFVFTFASTWTWISLFVCSFDKNGTTIWFGVALSSNQFHFFFFPFPFYFRGDINCTKFCRSAAPEFANLSSRIFLFQWNKCMFHVNLNYSGFAQST